MNNIDFAHLLHEIQGMQAEMTKLRHKVKLFKVNTQVPQRDGPWSKPNKVASAENNLPLVVNLPAAPQEKLKADPPMTNWKSIPEERTLEYMVWPSQMTRIRLRRWCSLPRRPA